MMRKALLVSLASVTCLGTANANPKTEFCNGDDFQCQRTKVVNSSLATVTSVRIIQQPTDGRCTKDDRKLSSNLAGGRSYMVVLDRSCKYRFKFKTTSGCGGDKSRVLTPEKMEKGKDEVRFVGGCGNLKVRFDKRGPLIPVPNG